MSPEKQRIAIATACGWTRFNCANHKAALLYGQPPNARSNSWELPHFHSDLNACHEMEKVLRFGSTYHQLGGFGLYRTALAEVCSEQHPINATAPQRCEAFLRTLGLWEEAQ